MTTPTAEKITLSAAAGLIVREMRETYVELRRKGLSDDAIAALCRVAIGRLREETR
jgi:hypothetical protein